MRIPFPREGGIRMENENENWDDIYSLNEN